MAEPGFLSAGTLASLARIRERAFTTRLDLHGRLSLVLRRNGVNRPVQNDVLVEWAGQQPTTGGADTVDVLGQEGEIQRWGGLDAKPGDQFSIGGRTAEVTTPAIETDGVWRADFRVTGGR